MPIKPTQGGGFEVSVCVRYQRAHRRLPPGTSASEAKRIEAELRIALGRKRPVVIPGDPLLTEILALYTEHADTLRSPETAKHHATRIVDWCQKYRASQTSEAVQHIVKDMRGHYAPATINRSLGALQKGLKLAWKQRRTPTDYSSLVERLPENNARTTTMTLEQVERLSSHASPAVRAAIMISIWTGCRRGEILKLKKSDIGKHDLTIQAGNTKTLRTRSVPIIKPLRPWLKEVPLSINFEGLKSGFRRAREAADMPHVTFHDLRRSCGTLMIQAGEPLHIVSKLLGHSSTAVTERVYAHLSTTQLRDSMRSLEVLHQRLHHKPKRTGTRSAK